LRLGNIEVPDLQVWLRSRRARWAKLRAVYQGTSRVDLADELFEVLNDCEALADALEERGGR